MTLSSLMHGHSDPRLAEMEHDAILSINLEANKDFAKRTSPGSIVIFLLLIISGFISNIPTDSPLFYYTVISFSLISIILHFIVLRIIHNLYPNTNEQLEVTLSFIVIITAICWGAFCAWAIIHYGITNTTLVFLLIAVGIGSGATASIFIKKRVAQFYLTIVLILPIIALMFLQKNIIALGLAFSSSIYFLYLFFQIIRSNDEYWKAIINTRKLETQAQELDKANKAKSNFLTNMSHDLRTPMNAILGFAQLLNKEPSLSSINRRHVSEINKAGLHLLELVNEILDLSKIEVGQLKLEHAEFDLFKNIDDLIAILAHSAHTKSLELEVFIDPVIPQYVIGDSLRIRQILTNLIGNAIKFTNEGRISLTVSTNSSGEYIFEVSDEGIGIPKEIQSTIFNPFIQADESNTRCFDGTGLGLAICDQLVKAMGGDIKVESQVGVGSKFRFKLPLASIEKNTNKIDLSGKNALFIGELSSGEYFKHYLENWGAVCDSAQDETHAKHFINTLREEKKEYFLLAMNQSEENIDISNLVSTLNLNTSTVTCLFSSKDNAVNIKNNKAEQHLSLPIKLTDVFLAQEILFNLNFTENHIKNEDVSVNTIKKKINAEDITVLLVEDNEINQMLAEDILSILGEFKVTIVSNGLEAIEKVKTDHFDLIIMDIHMPEMNGYDATQQIRELEKTNDKRHPIIAMTADAMLGVREKCLKSGMDDYISKPIDLDELQTKIESLLSINRS